MKSFRKLAYGLLLVATCVGADWLDGVPVQGDEILAPAAKQNPVGRRKAEVLWSATWFPAEVLEEKDGKFYIKYDNYGDNWNEWVGKDRIRFPAGGVEIAVLSRVEVLWGGTWFPAKVLETKNGKFHITYDNYGAEWNEWVGKDRIRLPGQPAVVEVAQVEIEWNGTWYPGKILEQKDGKFHVKYDGYSDASNEWVTKDRIRLPAKPAVVEFAQVEIEWNGTWYPGKILEQKDGKFHVKYDGYSDASNEWVTKDRIRLPGKPAVVEVAQVEIEWNGTWYPGKILEQKDGKFYVKYDGYSDASNEWVTKDRIRLPGKPAAVFRGKVEVEWGGTWFAAQILDLKEGKYYIKYDGYSDASNEWVGPERIRAAKGAK